MLDEIYFFLIIYFEDLCHMARSKLHYDYYHFYGSLSFASYNAIQLVLCVYNVSCASIFSTATVQLLSSSSFAPRAKVRLTRPSLRKKKASTASLWDVPLRPASWEQGCLHRESRQCSFYYWVELHPNAVRIRLHCPPNAEHTRHKASRLRRTIAS